jgi:hypothetical protein
VPVPGNRVVLKGTLKDSIDKPFIVTSEFTKAGNFVGARLNGITQNDITQSSTIQIAQLSDALTENVLESLDESRDLTMRDSLDECEGHLSLNRQATSGKCSDSLLKSNNENFHIQYLRYKAFHCLINQERFALTLDFPTPAASQEALKGAAGTIIHLNEYGLPYSETHYGMDEYQNTTPMEGNVSKCEATPTSKSVGGGAVSGGSKRKLDFDLSC